MADVERARRLIEQQQFRFAQEALREQHQLLLPAGEARHAAVVQVADAEVVQDGACGIEQLVADAQAKFFVMAEQYGFQHAQFGTDLAVLRHKTNIAQTDRRALPANRAAEALHGGDTLDERRFAGTVRADKADNLPRLQAGGNVAQDGVCAVADGNVFEFKTHAALLCPLRRMMPKSIGTPATAVMMPTGMAPPGERILPTTEAPMRMTAPVTAASGSAKR